MVALKTVLVSNMEACQKRKPASCPFEFLWRFHYIVTIDLSHWPLAIELNLQPHISLEAGVRGLKVPNL